MTIPLVVLAVGAMLAGFVGVPIAFEAVWPWTATIEHFLHPSFVAEGAHAAEEAHHMSVLGELGLMAFSVLIALGGIWFAYRNYVERPEAAERLAESLAGPHRVLTNKYYVDELYDATVVRGTMGSAGGLWTVDRQVVDGAVNGTRLDDDRGILGLPHPRQVRRRRSRQPDRLDVRRGQLRLPPGADRPDSELRVRHAARRVRARDLVPRRPVIGHCHEQ